MQRQYWENCVIIPKKVFKINLAQSVAHCVYFIIVLYYIQALMLIIKAIKN